MSNELMRRGASAVGTSSVSSGVAVVALKSVALTGSAALLAFMLPGGVLFYMFFVLLVAGLLK